MAGPQFAIFGLGKNWEPFWNWVVHTQNTHACVEVGSFMYPLKNLVSILEIPRDPLHVTKLFIV